MQGIFVAFTKNGTSRCFDNVQNSVICQENMITREIIGEGFYFKWNVLNKFLGDKCLVENDRYIICIDGVILNLKEKLRNEGIDCLFDLIIIHYQNGTLDNLLMGFRGSFCGVIFDKERTETTFFTDQLSTRPLFFYLSPELLIISSDVDSIRKNLKENNNSYSLDEIGIYSLLTYGYMIYDYTTIKEVKRAREGSIYRINGNKLKREQYYEISNSVKKITENEAVKTMDSLFENAVKLQYEKNKEYGYEDVVPLSAGMDCRMTSFMLKRINGKKCFTNFTYSETGEYDFDTAGKMAKYLKNRWIFKNLDGGYDLCDIEKNIDISDSLIYYFWPAQLNDFMKNINTKKWGIVHTGVLGDVVIGSFKKDQRYCRNYEIGDGAFSKKLIECLKSRVVVEDNDYEVGLFLNRGINGACMGYTTTFKYYCENLSPFMNVDFFNFCLSLPLSYRFNNHIYYKWVNRYFADATKYKHNGITIKGKLKFRLNGRYYRVRAVKDLTRNKLLQKYKKGYGMNPVQQWYDTNTVLQEEMNSFFENNICLAADMKNDIEMLYKTGTAQEKILALSALGAIKKVIS